MKFVFGNTRHFSLLMAIVLALMVFVVSVVIHEYYNGPAWLISLLLALITFFAIFLSLRYAMNRFIYDRIRLIYKTVQSTKLGKNGKRGNAERGDIIGHVNREVEQWSIDKSKEIDDLKKNEAYRREFLGNVAHELKTPITTIQGYVLTLLDGGLHDDSINKKYLQRTAKSIQRLIAVTNDLDEISKLESGVMRMTFEKFNFSQLVKEVFESMEMKAEKRGIVLNFSNKTNGKVLVMADSERIRQVLINLVDNSLKYGNRFGSTTVSVFDMDENYLIEVTDTGIGMEQSDLPRIFERFYRTEKSRSRKLGGSGLGLAIVKHIIEAHHQTIHVRSDVNVGTTFTFTLEKVKND